LSKEKRSAAMFRVRIFAFFSLFLVLALRPPAQASAAQEGEDASHGPAEPEAGRWLEDKEQPCFFYRGSCRGPERADTLIRRLYREGAVFVGLVASGDDPLGLRVYLPLDEEKREEIFAIANELLPSAGSVLSREEGQDQLTIWF